MNFRIISPDQAGQIDCVLRSQMIDFMPQSPDGIPFVPISYYPNFVFSNEMLALRGKKWVLCDMTEHAWDWDQQDDNVLGRGITHKFGHINTPEWKKLDDFVRDNPPIIQFKRELKLSDKSSTLMPVEHLCYLPVPPVVGKAEFDARPLEVMHAWGWSHPSRAILHADIFRAMTNENIGVVSEPEHLEKYLPHASPRSWASIYVPWYARRDMKEMVAFQQNAKISLSLWGAGKKCFRSAESPVGSIMALPYDQLAWSYDWNHGENCIRLHEEDEFRDLNDATKRTDLYEIYLHSQETIRKYESAAYVRDYIIPNVEAVL